MSKNFPSTSRGQIRSKKCKCLKTRCLKLYCECFSSGLLCTESCRCEETCQNQDKTKHDIETRNGTILEILKKNPHAFRKAIDSSTKDHRLSSMVESDENMKPRLSCSNSHPSIFNDSMVQELCDACRSGTAFGKRCTCTRSRNEEHKNTDSLLENGSQEVNGKRKRLKATAPMRQNDEDVVRPAMVLDTITGIPAPETSNGCDQLYSILDVDRDSSQLAGSDVSDGESSEDRNMKRLVQKTFDVIDKVLTAGIPHSALPQQPSAHSMLFPASLAKQILTNVSGQVKQLLRYADKAETRVRAAHLAKLKTPPRTKDRIISVGATFRKHFDSLGEFEGVVVALPTDSDPSYQVEYEDGGSESLSYESLVLLLGPEEEPENDSTQRTEVDLELPNSLDQQIHCARDNAVQEACKRLLSGKRLK